MSRRAFVVLALTPLGAKPIVSFTTERREMKPFQILLVISFLLTACAPRTTAASTPPAQATVASTPLSTEMPPVENTKIVPTPTEKAKTIEELAADILAGETVDTSALTPEQRAALDAVLAEHVGELAQLYLDGEIESSVIDLLSFALRQEFSIAYNELKNAQRDAIIYTDRNGDQFCVSPTLDLIPLSEVTDLEQQVIEGLPRVVDAEGVTHVYYQNEWVKIAGSDKIQFDNFDTFPWPVGEPVDPRYVPEEYSHLIDLTVPEYIYKTYGENVNMVPMFFLGKEFGQTDIAGRRIKGTVLGYVIAESDPYSVIPAMVTGIPTLYADNLSADSPGDIVEFSDFYKAIVNGNLYYLMYMVDQKEDFAITYPATNGQEATIKYEGGLAPSKETHGIITGKTNSNNIVLVNTTLLVEASGQPNK